MSKPSAAAPRVSGPWLRGFRWYVKKYLRKSFHTVCLAEPVPATTPTDAPLVVYLNHASWWDPLVAMHLSTVQTPGRTLFAPFDAKALDRYPVFQKLGFFGVDQETRRGAAQFLQTARAVLEQPNASIWMTPEGRFVDPRDQGADFRPGLAHLVENLARNGSNAYIQPLAIEYTFWEERLPEVLCLLGTPIRAADHAGLDKGAWDELLHDRLRVAQQDLAARSIAREVGAFRVLLGGKEGVGGFYESIRWLKAKLTGVPYRAAHSEKLTGPSVRN